jgi:hypothetical protein
MDSVVEQTTVMLQRFPFLRSLLATPWEQLLGGTKPTIARMSNTQTYTSNMYLTSLFQNTIFFPAGNKNATNMWK